MLTLFIFFILPTIIHSSTSPQNCVEISAYYLQNIIGFQNVTVSAKLSLAETNATETVAVNNFAATTTDKSDAPTRLCSNLENEIGLGQWNNDLSLSLNLENYQNQLFTEAVFHYYGVNFYYGTIDDGTFSPGNGTLFTPEIPCNNVINNDGDSLFENYTQCCTKFAPAPAAPSTKRCKSFTSTTTVLNSNDHYSIHASMKINYILTGNKISIDGTISGAPNGTIYVADQICTSKTPALKCEITIPSGDSKTLIKGRFVSDDNNLYPFPLIGRLLIRDGQTLMQEGVAFTPQNTCLYTNHGFMYHKDQVAHNQFCCSEFEN
jgi:hypothetical protein